MNQPGNILLAPSPEFYRSGSAVIAVDELLHILVTGQSNAVGASALPLLSTVAGPDNSVMFNGGIYPGIAGGNLLTLVPLVGVVDANALGENLCYAMTNKLASLFPTKKFVVSLTGAPGQKYSDIQKGSAFYSQHMAQISAAKTIADAAGIPYRVLAVGLVHGETDQAFSNVNYAANLATFQSDYNADSIAITGQVIPVKMFACQQAGSPANNPDALNYTAASALLLLQASGADPDNIIIPTSRYITTSVLSEPHFVNWSHRQLGEIYAKALKIRCFDNLPYLHVRPTAATLVADQIVIDFSVPVPPLAFRLSTVLFQPHYGFVYEDDTATALISSVALTGPAQVTITLDAIPTGANPQIRYACDVPTAAESNVNQVNIGGPRGNLADSDATASDFGFSLHNYCLAFRRLL